MKLKTLSALTLAATSFLTASSAMAWESEDGAHSTSASVALSTDYMWRGYTQTDDKPAISGSFDYAHSSGFYLGTWASNVDFNDDASAEIDIYAGFGGDIGDSGFGYDLGVLRYIYPGENYDWNEYYASLSYSFVTAMIAYTDDVYGSDEDAIYYNLSAGYDLPAGFSLSAAIGYYDYQDYSNNSPVDYSIGLSKELAGFGFDLSYIGTDDDGDDEYGEAADERLVFTISKSL
jgi:uncharacterized protein (TIGR02001 family)